MTPTPSPRVQLALNVSDLDAAVAFYERLFDTAPAKRRPGYANFAIAEPPLKLVLMEHPDAPERLNHLGIEVPTTAHVTAAGARLEAQGIATTDEMGVTCCFAEQDKVWVSGPDGQAWEIYTVLADADHSDPIPADPIPADLIPAQPDDVSAHLPVASCCAGSCASSR